MAGFRGPQQNPSELSESAYLQIFAKKRRFLQLRENRPFVVVKRLTHTQARSLKHPFDVKIRTLVMYSGCTKALQKLYESRLCESSPKAL